MYLVSYMSLVHWNSVGAETLGAQTCNCLKNVKLLVISSNREEVDGVVSIDGIVAKRRPFSIE